MTSMTATRPAPAEHHNSHQHDRWRTAREACRAGLLLLGLMWLAACSLINQGGRAAPVPTITLMVENSGYADVNVFAVRSEGLRGVRLGTVSGNTTVTFRVRETDLQPGGLMQLQARPIGGRVTWTSPTLPVTTGSVVKLDLIALGSTDFTRSQLYLLP